MKTTIEKWLDALGWVIFIAILTGFLLSATSCRAPKSLHKSTVDSSHTQTTTFIDYKATDSATTTSLLDSAVNKLWWNWLEETTTQEQLDTIGRVLSRTTTTKKSGTGKEEQHRQQKQAQTTSVKDTTGKSGTTTSATEVSKQNKDQQKPATPLSTIITIIATIVVIVQCVISQFLHGNPFTWILKIFVHKDVEETP